MKKIISVLLSVACIIPCFVTADKAHVFTDIAGHWAETEILEMTKAGFVTGRADGSFAPDEAITRAEFFAIAARLAGYEGYDKKFTASFADMNGREWYAPYVQYMSDKKLIHEGITREEMFEGERLVTREDVAVTCADVVAGDNYQIPVRTTLFDDHHEISDWAQRPMTLAVARGYIRGTDAVHLRPQKTVTRAEAITMLNRAYKDFGYVEEGKIKSGDAVIGASEYSAAHPDNNIVNDYGDKSKWGYSVKAGGREAGCAEASVSHLKGEGSTPEDGCIFYDIQYSGSGVINALQMKYELHKELAIETDTIYKCGFKAKLVDSSPDNSSVKVNVTKLRSVDDNNIVWSEEVLSYTIIESDGWLNYEYELTANTVREDVVLIWQFGGDEVSDVKLYFDDFYWVPKKADSEISAKQKNINLITVSNTNPADVQLTGGGDMDYNVYPELCATTTKESGLLLNYWQDPYRNKVSPNSVYTAPAKRSYTYRASFAPYEYEDKGFAPPQSDKIELTTTVPEISGNNVYVNGGVKLPAGYRLLDAGTIMYGGYWTENFNLFSEKIKNIPAFEISSNGEFESKMSMVTRYGVLARTYAIIENPDGNVMVQYSDTEYMHSSERPEKIDHNGIAYHELLQLFTSSVEHNTENHAAYIDSIKEIGADIVTVTPSEWKLNVWNSKTDGYWSDIAKYDGTKSLAYAQEVKDYVFSGGDPIADTLVGIRRNDLYMFIDQRMNDQHYNNDLTWDTHSWFWKSNPKYWLHDNNTTMEWNETPVFGQLHYRVFNYLNPEVRNYFYNLIEELVTGYDVDGLQMDFDRHYIYFFDDEAEMGAEVLTEFVGRVRELVNRTSIDRKKDIQVSVRLENDLEKVNSYGMDTEEWCRRDYVDILNVGDNYLAHTDVDVEGFKRIARNAKVFAEIHYVTDQVSGASTVRRYVTEHTAYAFAKNFYDRGADGISFFNFQYFPNKESFYPKLALCFDKEALETAEKNYVFPQPLSNTWEGAFGFGSEKKLDFKFNFTENLENFGSIVARLEYDSAADKISTKFVLNGTELKEIDREETELFPAYASNTAYATRNKVKFFEVPIDVFSDGENHFQINSSAIVMNMHLGFYN